MDDVRDRVLLVDDDRAVLEGLCRQHKKRFLLVPAVGPEAALRALREQGPFKAVVSDYQMPRMNGIQLLARAAELEPDVVRLMLTGQGDLTTAIDAVNRGHIFRFLTKPCPPDVFAAALDAAIEQHDLRSAEKVLLAETLRGAIEVLGDVLALSNPVAFGRATRIRRVVRHVVEALDLPAAWQYETAAILSQIGCVAVPGDVLDAVAAGRSLSPEQAEMIERHPDLARELLRKIPRLGTVAEIVGAQRSGAGPDAPREVRIGARILAAAQDFEELLSLGATPKQALESLSIDHQRYGQRILDALAGAPAVTATTTLRTLTLANLRVGMVLGEEVRNAQGRLLVPRGHEITQGLLERLRNYAHLECLAKREFRILCEEPEGGPARGAA